MKIKVSDASGKVLDWLVTKVEGHEPQWSADADTFYMGVKSAYCFLSEYTPSTDWSQGGPIIERERINHGTSDGGQFVAWLGCVSDYDLADMSYGPTPLIAAMRCFVASKLGDEVDVPQELMA